MAPVPAVWASTSLAHLRCWARWRSILTRPSSVRHSSITSRASRGSGEEEDDPTDACGAPAGCTVVPGTGAGVDRAVAAAAAAVAALWPELRPDWDRARGALERNCENSSSASMRACQAANCGESGVSGKSSRDLTMASASLRLWTPANPGTEHRLAVGVPRVTLVSPYRRKGGAEGDPARGRGIGALGGALGPSPPPTAPLRPWPPTSWPPESPPRLGDGGGGTSSRTGGATPAAAARC